jgi:hypothetical protein
MKTSAGVEFQLVPRAELTPARKSDMFQLLARHFDGVAPEQFARDLAEKNLVLLLRRGDTLVGFSTLLAYTTTVRSELRFPAGDEVTRLKCFQEQNGQLESPHVVSYNLTGPSENETVNVIYSGDTIVAPEAWGSTALPRAWVAGVNALRGALPAGRCFWLLLTSGFRTYRFLPVFWREFFPRFDAPTPRTTQRLLEQLARDRFGTQFDPRAGVVKFMRPQRLQAGLEQVPANRVNDPHVAFFLARNPGHGDGDELVCLTELCPENLTAAGRRMMTPQICAADPDHR